MTWKDTRELIEEIAGASAVRRVFTAMRKNEPVLGKFARSQVRMVTRTIKSFGAPPSVPQAVEDTMNLLVARLYEGLERGRRRLWEEELPPSED